jgi:hypothetical protein
MNMPGLRADLLCGYDRDVAPNGGDETGFALKNYRLRNLLALTQINHIDFCAE